MPAAEVAHFAVLAGTASCCGVQSTFCPQIQGALLKASNFPVRRVLRQQKYVPCCATNPVCAQHQLSPGRRFRLGAVAPWRAGRSRRLTGRINGSIIHRMGTRSLSANQLAALSALIATPATKAKASITLSGNLLKVIDSLAGAAQRSAWIERAVQSYAARQLKEQRRERELALLNRHADALNSEGDDSASYQANWTAE